MTQAIKEAAIWLRLVDAHDGKLSLTNIVLLIALVKLAITPAASLTDACTLFAALASYGYKKFLNQDAGLPEDVFTPQIEALKTQIEATDSKVASLSISSGFKR